MRRICNFILFLTLVSCESYSILQDVPMNSGIKNTIERAKTLAQISWIPLSNLEANPEQTYPYGFQVLGAPYSSVKEIQTYIGQDVSLYTFLTSTKNPYSLLYTERINQAPYKGTNCRLYYGVVCSSAIMYALGISIPYSTRLFVETNLFKRCEKQSPDDIFLGSILLEPGHMLMVVGIERDSNGKIYSVDLFEASSSGTHINNVSYNQLYERWISKDIVQYEYLDIANNTESVNFSSDINILNQDISNRKFDLCPNKGDKSSYSLNEKVVVDILDIEMYDTAELFRNESQINLYDISLLSDNKIEILDLPPGNYSMRLTKNGTIYSDFVYFEVLDNSTNVEVTDEIVNVKCESINAIPEFISINSVIDGAALYYYDIIEQKGEYQISVKNEYKENTYIRVIYKGEYGRVYYQQKLM